MAITQVISAITPSDPRTQTRDEFSASAPQTIVDITDMVTELNTWSGEVNAIAATSVGDVATAIGAAGADTPVDADKFTFRKAADGLLKSITLSGLKGIFAALAGSATQAFSVGSASIDAHAMNRGGSDARYAALAGSATQAFSVASASADQHAMNRGGSDARYAAIANKGAAQTVTSASGAVATGTTVMPYDNSIPQITEGDQYLSVSITPTNASSTLEIDVQTFCTHSSGIGVMTMALFKDAGADALASAVQVTLSTNLGNDPALKHRISAGSTSAQTFRVRIGSNQAGTTTFNGSGGAVIDGGVLASRITIREYLP